MSISVVISSYRYGHLAAHAVESVVGQTRVPERIFFVDDGVHDCKHIPKLYPEVTYVERMRNLGIVENFNKMLGMVPTERVLFLGADNWLHPQALEIMGSYEEDIVSCDAYIVGDGKFELLHLPYQPHGSALYNVQKAKEVGGYEASGNKHSEEDSVLFKRMLDGGASFRVVEEPLLFYRQHRRNFND